MKTVTVTTSYKIPLSTHRCKNQFSRNFQRDADADKFVESLKEYQGLCEDEKVETIEVK